MKSITLTEKDISRFWSKVKIGSPDKCWEWKGKLDAKGYGHFQISHINPLGRDNPRAHRVSYYIHYGEIPNTLSVCHKCDNPSCVNPHHLFVGTYDDNNKDRARKGRSSHGETHPKAVLTEEQAILVMQMRHSGKSQREIGKSLGVSHVAIGNIFRGITWKHLKNTEVQNE